MSCSARSVHVPTQPASDSHHVIPQAWQHFLKGKLFDRRTVEVCPNCHRGVHERIVVLMHGGSKGRDKLWAIANLAPERYQEAGGDLDTLRAAGLYGSQ
jgi:hypothetical protein